MNTKKLFACRTFIYTALCLAMSFFSIEKLDAEVSIKTEGKLFTIENQYLSRTLTIENKLLKTVTIFNKRLNKKVPLNSKDSAEFSLRYSKEMEIDKKRDKGMFLTSKDFKVVSHKQVDIPGGKSLVFTLKKGLLKKVEVHYQLRDNEFYMRKHLVFYMGGSVALDRIDVESLQIDDAYQPYNEKQIYAQGKWSTGLGQPLYTKSSGLFMGIEFPAAYNYVDKDNNMVSGYFWGQKVGKRVMSYKKYSKRSYKTYSAVLGVSAEEDYVQDAFMTYIDNIRARPHRLQTQYNSWFDFGGSVDNQKFAKSVKTIHKKLVIERKVRPLRAYVIDDGWQNAQADWSKQHVWPVQTKKFDEDFAMSFKTISNAQSSLGLWLTPALDFGAKKAVRKLRKAKFETLKALMSLAGPKYMQALDKRLVEFTEMGVSYFKLDGLFGHLNRREFEINGKRYRLPYLDKKKIIERNLTPSSKKLNDKQYDELKIAYLVAGSERLIDIFTKMGKINKDVYIVISNGSWLSPWWLMHIDAVWMINAGDAASGSTRTEELVYRDGVYYHLGAKENTQFPISSIFNHEPKKVKTGESKEKFLRYLYMNMSRGTGFIELYIKTAVLSDSDWDVVAEGLNWAEKYFSTFKTARMHGGNPSEKQVYGYTGWTKDKGYISIHNPSKSSQAYKLKLDRKLGMLIEKDKKATYRATSPLTGGALKKLNSRYTEGSTLTFNLAPEEIILINFNR